MQARVRCNCGLRLQKGERVAVTALANFFFHLILLAIGSFFGEAVGFSSILGKLCLIAVYIRRRLCRGDHENFLCAYLVDWRQQVKKMRFESPTIMCMQSVYPKAAVKVVRTYS